MAHGASPVKIDLDDAIQSKLNDTHNQFGQSLRPTPDLETPNMQTSDQLSLNAPQQHDPDHVGHTYGTTNMDSDDNSLMERSLLSNHDKKNGPLAQHDELRSNDRATEDAEQPSLSDRLSTNLNGFPDITMALHKNEPQIQSLYDAYAQGFSNRATFNEEHLERAKPLAIALLHHHYPKDQDYIVQSVTFEQLNKSGWSFWLNPDVDQAYPAAKKGKAKAMKTPKAPVYPGMYHVKYHVIESEHIVGYVVLRGQFVLNDDGNRMKNYLPHTYLAIMMDNLETFDQWVPERFQTGTHVISNPRHDLLRYSLGTVAEIREGYGIILLGPRLEFYKYDYDKPISYTESTEDYVLMGPIGQHWVTDVRTAPLASVDQLFKEVVARNVRYASGHVALAPETETPVSQPY